MALPSSVIAMAESGMQPFEDIFLAILREGLPDVRVTSLVSDGVPDWSVCPQVVIRRDHSVGGWDGDPRFIDKGRLAVSVFTYDETGLIGGDQEGAQLSEAVRQVMFNAWQSGWRQPGLGSIKKIWMTNEPSKVPDWQTSSGPVQYANLPVGWSRYETKYAAVIRKPLG